MTSISLKKDSGTQLNADTPCPSCGGISAQIIANRDGKTNETSNDLKIERTDYANV